jgi:hypothetical protein
MASRKSSKKHAKLGLTLDSASADGGNFVLLPEVGLIGVAGGFDGAGEAAEEPALEGVPTS